MELMKHDLAHEFPEYLEKMNQLKASDAHFSTLCEHYDAHNHTITQYEQGKTAIADDELEVLKKKRLEFKDEIYQTLKAD
ncbi:YdcH family protein [soil metagenome]